jgi:hypothetical protein
MRSGVARLLYAFILAGAPFTAAVGADELQSSAPENLTPGVAQPVPADAMASTNAWRANKATSPIG